MTDIVERLRDPTIDVGMSDRLIAADEIERMHAAKRRWSNVADERATQVAELRDALRTLASSMQAKENALISLTDRSLLQQSWSV
jgi:hypothetical protein